MKKLLLLIVLLINLLVSAQSSTDIIMAGVKQRDAQRAALQKEKTSKDSIAKHANANYDYLKSLNKIATDKEALKIAEDIAGLQTKKVRLLRSKDLPDISLYIVRFVPEEMTTEQYDALDNETKDKFLTVRFSYWNEGENKDLEIKGIKTYRLSQVSGSYLQMFPVWKTYCKYDADLVKTQENSTNTFADIPENLHYLFRKDRDIWVLMNR
ncbi:hypothetical protein [Flavobacterium sp.]|uniref:hypothetical protein n=1 Tax=Flavobacterium sp. TaxID=239 RepID=UPI003753DF7F